MCHVLDIGRRKLEKALRYNEGKSKWSYVDFKSLQPMIEVLMFGAEKYAPHNWKKGLNREEILESMQRHLIEMFDNNEVDSESGKLHIGHLMCNCMFYAHFLLKSEEEKVNEG